VRNEAYNKDATPCLVEATETFMGEDSDAAVRSKGLERLLGLTDDVFAFAITLLVLELVTPVVVGPLTNSSLASALAGEWPYFLDYLVSFWVIGFQWLGHHHVFRYIKRSDERLLMLNLLFLFFIVLIPFATRVLDSYESLPLAVAVYALVQVGASLIIPLIWRYASVGRRLIDERVSQRMIRWFGIRGFVIAAMFAASIPFAFIYSRLPVVWWLAILPVIIVLDRRYGRETG